MKLKRTHNCGELRLSDKGKKVVLSGWVENYRDHGGVAFIDLYDRWGITQIVFDPQIAPEAHSVAHTLRSQFVIAVEGEVRPRLEGMSNANLSTGDIEVYVKSFELLNKSKTPPFDIQHSDDVNPEMRLVHRYLDLRSKRLQNGLILRSRVTGLIRKYFLDNNFVEIETPILTKSSPEGARDYLVPSRINHGSFYALPQSPQQFKQILMISGYDRYFQIARCFRDEDLRADRQPEFTQVDLEMSFVDRDDIMNMLEGLFKNLMKEVFDQDIKLPFKRIPYDEAMLKYGSDKPDLRFDLEIVDCSDIFKNSGFGVFKNAVSSGGLVRSINLKGAADKLSRKDLDEMTPFIKPFRGKGVAWIKMNADGPQSPIVKFFSKEESEALYKRMNAETGDVLIFVADQEKIVCQSLDALRKKMADKLGLINKKEFNFSWIIDFPLFEKDDKGNPTSMHHPFTAPIPEDEALLDTDVFSVKTNAYDLVLNGNEIGGGSVRIHDEKMQAKIFKLLGISDEEAKEKFGFLLEALQYGAPPHAGLALGLDRIMMLFLGTDSIRDVIAFPKTQKAICMMSEAPSAVAPEQLEELSIEISEIEEDDEE